MELILFGCVVTLSHIVNAAFILTKNLNVHTKFECLALCSVR